MFIHEFSDVDPEYKMYISQATNQDILTSYTNFVLLDKRDYSSLALLPPRRVLVYMLAEENHVMREELMKLIIFIGIYQREGKNY